MPLEVHVVTPERELWSGDASSVVAQGVDGAVGILAGHAPLMIRLAIGPLRILRDGDDDLVAVVDGGFLHVTSAGDVSRVDVLAAQAEMGQDIDLDRARSRLTELEDRLRELDTGVAEAEVERVKGELLKAQARINLAS